MARANIMMWLASTGKVILAKGFLRYPWFAQPGTLSEKRNLGAVPGERARLRKREGAAVGPARGALLPWTPRQRARPFAICPLVGWGRGADHGVSTVRVGPSPPSNQIN